MIDKIIPKFFTTVENDVKYLYDSGKKKLNDRKFKPDVDKTLYAAGRMLCTVGLIAFDRINSFFSFTNGTN